MCCNGSEGATVMHYMFRPFLYTHTLLVKITTSLTKSLWDGLVAGEEALERKEKKMRFGALAICGRMAPLK